MIRTLRFALRSLFGPWLVLPVLALDVVAARLRGAPWRGEGLWTVDWFALMLFYILPLVAGCAAVDAARLTRDGMIHHIRTSTRGPLILVRAAAWSAVPVIVVHLLVVVCALIFGGARSSSGGWFPVVLALVTQLVAIGWVACIGSVIGRLLPTLLAGIVAVTLTLIGALLVGEAAGQTRFHPLLFGASSVSRVGWTTNDAYLWTQVALFLTTGALLMCVLPRRTAYGKRPTLAGAGVLGLTAILLIGSIVFGPTHRLTADPTPPSQCTGTAPVVCLYPEHERFAADIDAIIQELVTGARKQGYDAIIPKRVEESSRTYHATGDGVVRYNVESWIYEGVPTTVQDVVEQIITPSQCRQLYGSVAPDNSYWTDLASLRVTWLSFVGVPPDKADTQGQHLSPSEAATITARFARCDIPGGDPNARLPGER